MSKLYQCHLSNTLIRRLDEIPREDNRRQQILDLHAKVSNSWMYYQDLVSYIDAPLMYLPFGADPLSNNQGAEELLARQEELLAQIKSAESGVILTREALTDLLEVAKRGFL